MLARPGADLTDVYVFPAPRNDANVVLAVDAHPLIAPDDHVLRVSLWQAFTWPWVWSG